MQYIGTKIVTAVPMTRGEYNGYRGWSAPEGEDQAVAGYLVEYLDGGAANDARHAGYISWSPSDVFDTSYICMGDVRGFAPHQQRVIAESAELSGRLGKLLAFFETDMYKSIDFDEQDRLSHQGVAMQEYSNLLKERIAAFK